MSSQPQAPTTNNAYGDQSLFGALNLNNNLTGPLYLSYKAGLNHIITTFNLLSPPRNCRSFLPNQTMTRNSSLGEILTPRDAAQLINLDLVNLPNPPNGSIQIHK
ncbi:Uncharacterized protein HZ326_10241 [Fusarium oxysporum f. sp. albedinis]|nr:Uncharacterized protein HZ326_10241 [Fusarium oxysporum f. sp. albedinis]